MRIIYSLRSVVGHAVSCMVLVMLESTLCFAAAAETVDTINKEPIKLPPMIVQVERFGFENWTKTVSENFVIYTDEGNAVAEKVIRKIECLRAAAPLIYQKPLLKGDRQVFILPSSHSDWNKLEHIGDIRWKPHSVTLCESPEHVILLQKIPLIPGMIVGTDRDFHFFIHVAEKFSDDFGMPHAMWYKYGFYNVVGFGKVTGDHVEIGRFSFLERIFGPSRYLPWDKFFAITTKSPEFKASSTGYMAQSMTFVRYMLANSDTGMDRKMIQWANLLAAGQSPTEANFKEVVGMDYAQLREAVKDFHRHRTTKLQSWAFRAGEVKVTFEHLVLSAREMRELFILGQILNQNRPESLELLDHLLKKGLKTEPLRGLLYNACRRRERPVQALEQLQVLMQSGTENPQVYEEAARIGFAISKLSIKPDMRLGESEAEIRRWSTKALSLKPNLRGANRMLAICEAFGKEAGPSCVTSIQRIRALLGDHPMSLEIDSMLAVALWRAGESVRSLALCKQLCQRKDLHSDMRSLVSDLITQLESSAPHS